MIKHWQRRHKRALFFVILLMGLFLFGVPLLTEGSNVRVFSGVDTFALVAAQSTGVVPTATPKPTPLPTRVQIDLPEETFSQGLDVLTWVLVMAIVGTVGLITYLLYLRLRRNH